MSRPVYIINNRHPVTDVIGAQDTVMFGRDYRFNFNRYKPPVYSSANLGDILFCEIETDHLFIDSTYDITKYPIEAFEPIAVCIYPASEHNDGYSVWMSAKWMDPSRAGQGSINGADMSWGKTGTRINNSRVENSIIQNDRVKNLDNSNWQSKTSWAVSDYSNYYPAFEVCWRYKTPGTQEGDWLLPSYYDMYKCAQNNTLIKGVYNSIKTVSNNQYLNRLENWMYLSSDDSTSSAGAYTSFNGTSSLYMNYPGKTGKVFVRAVMLKQ